MTSTAGKRRARRSSGSRWCWARMTTPGHGCGSRTCAGKSRPARRPPARPGVARGAGRHPRSELDLGPGATDVAYADAFRPPGSTSMPAPGRSRGPAPGPPAAVVLPIVGYLDSWSLVRRFDEQPAERWRRPLAVARSADPDPYRDRLRALVERPDLKAERGPARPVQGSAGRRAVAGQHLAGLRANAGRRPARGGCRARAGRATTPGRRVDQLQPGPVSLRVAHAARGGGTILHDGAGVATGDGP